MKVFKSVLFACLISTGFGSNQTQEVQEVQLQEDQSNQTAQVSNQTAQVTNQQEQISNQTPQARVPN